MREHADVDRTAKEQALHLARTLKESGENGQGLLGNRAMTDISDTELSEWEALCEEAKAYDPDGLYESELILRDFPRLIAAYRKLQEQYDSKIKLLLRLSKESEQRVRAENAKMRAALELFDAVMQHGNCGEQGERIRAQIAEALKGAE